MQKSTKERSPAAKEALPLPQAVLQTLDRLRAAGYEAYIVGGCVRDFLRGVTPKDYDITTSARPEEVHAVFRGERILDTGIQHGTVTLLADGLPLEITTYRVDGDYRDARHPESVRFSSSLREDAARRDFTVNAIAYHPKEGFFDFFGGRADLSARLIRAVGNPRRRFEEDALRILRALRFASVLDFAIEEETARAALEKAPLLSRIAGERIREELFKLLTGRAVARVLTDYGNVLSELFSREGKAEYDGTRVLRSIKMLPLLPEDPALRLAALLLPQDRLGGDATAFLGRLRLDRRTEKRIQKLCDHASDPCVGSTAELRRFLAGVGETDALALYALHKACAEVDGDADRLARLQEAEACVRALCSHDPVLGIGDLALRGTDVLALGVPPGPQIGQTLSALLNAVLDGAVTNEKNALLAFAREHLL